ncbi:MAG: hypothetical protein RLZ55_1772, partial [Actinomycetota bacterium]
DILKEYVARGTYIFPPAPSMRLITDIFQFCAKEVPYWNTISISGYHIREAGSTALQELAFTLRDGMEYVKYGVDAGLDVDAFAPRLSFFFNSHMNFFEEIAKFRAARRIWARWLRDEYGATDERAQWLRFHTQTAGVSLTGAQPINNVVRTAIEALAGVLGGTNSLHTNALDEVLALPTAQAAEIALRTQQVIMLETGVTNVADPLGGSWYLEALTDRIEAEAEAIFANIIKLGGATEDNPHPIGPITAGILRGIEDGWFTGEIADSSFAFQQALEDGRKHQVGVTVHTETITEPLEILRISHDIEVAQVAALSRRKLDRDDLQVTSALMRLTHAAGTDQNLVPIIIEAARHEATLGEICHALRGVWGEYREPAQI